MNPICRQPVAACGGLECGYPMPCPQHPQRFMTEDKLKELEAAAEAERAKFSRPNAVKHHLVMATPMEWALRCNTWTTIEIVVRGNDGSEHRIQRSSGFLAHQPTTPLAEKLAPAFAAYVEELRKEWERL